MSGVKKIDVQSDSAMHNALNIFAVPPTNVSIHKSQWRELLPLNSIDESPYEFRVFSDSQWMDPSKVYLYLQLQLLKKTTTDATWVPVTNFDQKVAPIQAIGQSFVRQLRVNINGTDVYDSTAQYPYISYMRNELTYSPTVKDTWLSASGYHRDTKHNDPLSDGFVKRQRMSAASRVFEVMSRLDFDLANQDLFLLNNLEILFTVYKKEDEFLVHSLVPDDTTEYALKVHNVRLMVRTIDVQPSLNLSVMSMLEKTTAKYPLRRTEIRTCYLTDGRREFTHNIFSNVIPRRIVLAMVNNRAYNGDIALDPFKFEPFNVEEILVNAGGITYPASPYKMKWGGNGESCVLRPYMEMMDATMSGENTTNGITLQQYASGWTFFVVSLTPTPEDHRGFELVRNGTTTIHMRFSKEIEAPGVMLLCLAEFDQLLSIDQHRVVLGDGAV